MTLLTDLRELKEKATPGKWSKKWDGRKEGEYITAPTLDTVCEVEMGNHLWCCDDPEDGCMELAAEFSRNFDLIVALVNNAEAILDALEDVGRILRSVGDDYPCPCFDEPECMGCRARSVLAKHAAVFGEGSDD